MLKEIWQRVSGKENHVSSKNKLTRCFVYGISDARRISPNNHLLHLRRSDLEPVKSERLV